MSRYLLLLALAVLVLNWPFLGMQEMTHPQVFLYAEVACGMITLATLGMALREKRAMVRQDK